MCVPIYPTLNSMSSVHDETPLNQEYIGDAGSLKWRFGTMKEPFNGVDAMYLSSHISRFIEVVIDNWIEKNEVCMIYMRWYTLHYYSRKNVTANDL